MWLRSRAKLSVDGQAKHDLKWVGIWAATTLVFPLIGYFTHSAWWMGHLSPAPSCTSMAWASFGAWRDRVAQAKREDEVDT